MHTNKSDSLDKTEMVCSICHKEIKSGEEYHHNSKVMCEDCCIDVSTPCVRKTHWQYLGSIKTEYLIPGKNS